MTTAFWRKWHRWIGFPAAIFLLFASITGLALAFTEFFGAEEALREATRSLVSPVAVDAPAALWSEPLARAMAAASLASPGAPVDRVTLQFKGPQPTVTIFTGNPGGGEAERLVVDAKSGALLERAAYADKAFLNRLHSGEAFGDGGLVVAMMWALSLILLTISGFIIYLRMRMPNRTGIKKIFWLVPFWLSVATLGAATTPASDGEANEARGGRPDVVIERDRARVELSGVARAGDASVTDRDDGVAGEAAELQVVRDDRQASARCLPIATEPREDFALVP
jgi:hypothetical protein